MTRKVLGEAGNQIFVEKNQAPGVQHTAVGRKCTPSKVIQFMPTDTHFASLLVWMKFFTHGNLYLFTSLGSYVRFADTFTPFVKD